MDDKKYYLFYDFISQIKYKSYLTTNQYLKDQVIKSKHKCGNHPRFEQFKIWKRDETSKVLTNLQEWKRKVREMSWYSKILSN